MYIGNLLLLIMNLPLAGLFARLLQIRYSWIYPPILAICVTGVISHANNVEDAWLMLGFGVVGWLMKRYDWPAAPMVLGLVLGPLFENTLRQSLTLSHGSGMIFLSRPIAAVLLLIALLAVLVPPVVEMIRQRRALARPRSLCHGVLTERAAFHAGPEALHLRHASTTPEPDRCSRRRGGAVDAGPGRGATGRLAGAALQLIPAAAQ